MKGTRTAVTAAAFMLGVVSLLCGAYFTWYAVATKDTVDQSQLIAAALAAFVLAGGVLGWSGRRISLSRQQAVEEDAVGETPNIETLSLSGLSVDPPFGQAPSVLRGRSELMQALIRSIPSGLVNPQEKNRPQILYGMGGVGKTAVALALAQEATDRQVDVFWLSCRSQTVLHAGALEVFSRIQSTEQILRPDQPDAALTDALWRRLEQSSRPWLLVLDNADDGRVLGGAQFGNGWVRPSRRGLVLVTTRIGTAGMWGDASVMLRVPPLLPDAGGQVLTDLTGARTASAGTHDEAQLLAERLGGLPLALRAAGRLLAQPMLGSPAAQQPRTFRSYRAALDREFALIDAATTVEAAATGENDLRNKVGATWELSLQLLDERGMPDARTLLNLLACYAPEPIPWILLDDTVLRAIKSHRRATAQLLEPDRRDAVLSALRDLGLIDTDESASDPLLRWADDTWTGTTMVVLHPVVRDAVLQSARSDSSVYGELWATTTHLLLHARAVIGDRDTMRDWLRWHMLAPHVSGLLKSYDPAIARKQRREFRKLLYVSIYLASVMRRQQDAQAAVELMELAAGRVRHGFPRRSLVGLRVRYQLGQMLWAVGRHEEADKQFESTYLLPDKILRRLMGDRFPMLYRAMNNLHQGPVDDEVLNVLIDGLRLGRRIYGRRSFPTLMMQHALATSHLRRGEFDQAVTLFNELIQIGVKKYGRTDTRTLNSRHWLAQALEESGDLAGAVDQMREVLAAHLGSDNVLAIQTTVAPALGNSALPSLAAGSEQPENPLVLSVRRWLGELLEKQGDLAGAEAEFRRVVASVKKTTGPADPTVLHARGQLGRLLETVEAERPQAEVEQTADLLEQIYRGRIEQLGADDPDTLRAGYMLSVILEHALRYDEARELKREVLALRREALGPAHPDTVQSAEDPSLAVRLVGPAAPGTRGRTRGPFDLADAPDEDGERLDLGALRIEALDGVEVRVNAQEGVIESLVLVDGESALQLGVFAAPADEGIWADVQTEIEESMRADGNHPVRLPGPYGEETIARVSANGGTADVRFVGIDGPGWMVRALYQGAVVSDPEAAPKLIEAVRTLIVDRGAAVLPIRTALVMNLPAAFDRPSTEEVAAPS